MGDITYIQAVAELAGEQSTSMTYTMSELKEQCYYISVVFDKDCDAVIKHVMATIQDLNELEMTKRCIERSNQTRLEDNF